MSTGINNNIEIAEIRVTVNKYRPWIHPFYIPNLAPYKSNTAEVKKGQKIPKSNLTNKNPEQISMNSFSDNGLIFIPLPKHIAVTYPEKYIPAGAKFQVLFVGGDITKPIIIGRYDDHGKS